MNAKAKGTYNEHRSMRLLEAAGYQCTRSGASLGTFDIIGIGSRDVVLVQVKTRDWPGTVEMEAIKLFPAPRDRAQINSSLARTSTHAGRAGGVRDDGSDH